MNKLDSDIEVDQYENTLEYAKCFKKKLRFDIGETVFLKSDNNRKFPQTITAFSLFDSEYDYVCTWSHPKKGIVRDFFLDKVLTT